MNSNSSIVSSSSRQRALAAALALALVPSCGFITVNGKPLVASTSSSSPGGGDSTGGGSEPAIVAQGDHPAAPAGRPASTKRIEDIPAPDPKAALSTWTAAQQWMPHGKWGAGYGYSNLSGAIALADELGDRLSELGRASLIAKCFEHAKEDASSALIWAICGHDVAVLDLHKLRASSRPRASGRRRTTR